MTHSQNARRQLSVIGSVRFRLCWLFLQRINSQQHLVFRRNLGPPTILEAKEQRGSWLFLRCFSPFLTARKQRKAVASEQVQRVVSMKNRHI
jgi:hypothetical protein